MLTASGAFDLVMQGREMRVAGIFTLDLPVVGYTFTKALKSISLDVANQTDLPDAVRATVGFGTMGGSATFAGPVGQGLEAYELLNPDNPASPIYRQTIKGALVTWSAGVRVRGSVAPETPLAFTGRVTSVSVDHANKAVTVGLVDLTIDWGQTPDIPAVITQPPYNAGLTSEFAMDQLVRFYEGASSWPARRPQCVLAAGMRSSIQPEVGFFDPTYPQPLPVFGPGAWGTALVGTTIDPTLSFVWESTVLLLDQSTWPLTNALAFEVTVTNAHLIAVIGIGKKVTRFHAPGTPQRYGVDGVAVQIDSTGIHVTGQADGSFDDWLTPINDATHTILFWLSISGGVMTCHAKIDGGATHTFTGLTFTDDTSQWIYAKASAFGASIEGLQITTETAPVTSYPFTPQAVLDPSLNPLTVVPAIPAGSSGLDIFQQMAAAELGYARRGPDGVFRFTNRDTIAQAAVSKTVTSRVSLKGFTTSIGDTTEYDRVDVPYTEWTFGAATLIWSLASKKRIRPGQTLTWTQHLPDGVLAADIDTTASLLPNTHAVDDGHSWYRASLDSDGINPYAGSLPITLSRVGPGAVIVSIRNPSRQNVWLVSPSTYTDTTTVTAGDPALWIGGVPATAGDEAIASAIIGAGSSALALTSSPYLQDHDTAVTLGQYVLGQVYVAIRNFTSTDVVPDSRTEITDKHLVQDPDRSDVNEYALVWGTHFSADFTKGSESWTQSLDYRALAASGGWIGEVAGRSEGELTTWGY